MATLGSFDYPDELLKDCGLSAATAREASHLIETFSHVVTGAATELLQKAADVLRHLASDTNEEIFPEAEGEG